MSDLPTERGMRSNAAAQQGTGTGTGNTYGTGTGTTQGTGTTYGTNPASGPAPTTAGYHKHDFLNKYDPFVNSTTGERFHPSATTGPQIGGTCPSPGPGATGVSTTEGGGVSGGAMAESSTRTAGSAVPGHAHKSDLLNKLDPRVNNMPGAQKGRRGGGGSGGPVA